MQFIRRFLLQRLLVTPGVERLFDVADDLLLQQGMQFLQQNALVLMEPLFEMLQLLEDKVF